MSKKNKDKEHKFEPDIKEPEPTHAPNPDRISSESEAIDFVRLNYKIPDNVKTVYVSEDKQVFYRRNTATNHGNQTQVKIFAIKWD